MHMPPSIAEALRRSERGRRTTRRLLMQEPPKPGDLTAAMADAISLFRQLKIKYALVGGLAAMLYGRSRYTEDVDFVAEPDHEAVLARNPEAMKRFGFDPACTWKLYHRSGIDIDIWKDRHAPGILERARRKKLGDRFARVAELHDLIAMKLRADRPQDDYDISEMLRRQDIDADALADRVTRAQLRRFRAIERRTRDSPDDPSLSRTHKP